VCGVPSLIPRRALSRGARPFFGHGWEISPMTLFPIPQSFLNAERLIMPLPPIFFPKTLLFGGYPPFGQIRFSPLSCPFGLLLCFAGLKMERVFLLVFDVSSLRTIFTRKASRTPPHPSSFYPFYEAASFPPLIISVCNAQAGLKDPHPFLSAPAPLGLMDIFPPPSFKPPLVPKASSRRNYPL